MKLHIVCFSVMEAYARVMYKEWLDTLCGVCVNKQQKQYL